MTFNADLAKRVLAQIKDHPETWEQDSYRCETGMCFAGWAIELEGVGWRNWNPHDDVTASGRFAPDEASRLLGLGARYSGGSRARALFDEDNDLDRIERLVKHFANNPDDDSLPEAAS